MGSALPLLGAFLLFDLLAAVLLIVLVAVVHRRDGRQRLPVGALLGALTFLGVCGAFIYGGIWMWLRVL